VILLIRAVLALALVVIVVVTGELRPGLANVIGVYWFLGGLLTLRWPRAHRGIRGEFAPYGAALAACSAALAVFARSVIAGVVREEVVLTFLGIFSIIIGLLRAS